MPGDPFFSSVSLLMHCDGTNGSTTFIDNSPAPLTLTAASAMTISTTHPAFGTGAANAGSLAATVNTGATTPFQLGAGQFTVEGWVYLTSYNTSNQYCLVGNFAGSANLGWYFGFVNGSLVFYYSTTGTNTFNIGTAYTPALNTWLFITADRDASNVLRVYAGGVVVASGAAAATIFASTANYQVGNDNNLNRAIPGQFDEVRVTKGVARYAGAFTPPTAAFPDTPFFGGEYAVTVSVS